MNQFVYVLTYPVVALFVSITFSVFILVAYGETAPVTRKKYSRFLPLYKQLGGLDLLIVSLISGIGSLFSIVGAYPSKGEVLTTFGWGVYVYATFALSVFLICIKPVLTEKRDIKGLHKQQVKCLHELLTFHTEQLHTQYAFEGKTSLKVQRIADQFAQLIIEVTQEKKIRKNRENVYRSLERLEKLEYRRMQLMSQLTQLDNEIANLYDALYALEAVALEARYENLKKPLQIIKDTLQRDPYAAQMYLKQMEEAKQPV